MLPGLELMQLVNDPVLIGDWLVDPRDDSVVRGNERVKLEPRTMRLLMRLAQTPGEVVSQDELLESVWTGVVVGTASVYQSMSQLRKVLGDTDDPPRYIETVARKGYRLVAKVSPPPKAHAPEATDAEPAHRGHANRQASLEAGSCSPVRRHSPSWEFPGGSSCVTRCRLPTFDRGAAIHRPDYRQDRAGLLRRAHGRNLELAGAAADVARGRQHLRILSIAIAAPTCAPSVGI